MPQSLVISNGNLLANFDEHLQMRDFYYPYVGDENHTMFGHVHRVGVWVDGQFAWLDSGEWKFDIRYHKDTLVGNSTARHERLGIKLRFEDFVYTTHDILFRKVTIENLREEKRLIKIFFSHDFFLYGDKIQDTAQYEPDLNAVLHYRKKRYFLIDGQWEDSGKGMAQFATGKSHFGDKQGTYYDASDDGILGGNPIEQGSVDSTVGFEADFSGYEQKVLFLWVAVGKNYKDVLINDNRVEELGAERIYEHTSDYWKEWSRKGHAICIGVSENAEELFYRSLLIIRSQIDNRGAIIASTDSDIMKFNRDTYTYMWPRDGAFVATALSRTKYFEIVRNFLLFCDKLITEDGYLLHKYTPGGSLGSSWHPKWKHGKKQLPIQEDESALILVALQEYYRYSETLEVVQKLFNSTVLKIGRFLVHFVDEKTGLPLPTYDLWEEQRGVFSYTGACTYAGLEAAANLSKWTGHYHDEKIFREAARKMKSALLNHLYSEEHNRFLKKVELRDGVIVAEDPTVDASLAFVWDMGLLPADDPKIISTMETIQKELRVQTEVGGIARYSGDFYQRDWNHQYSAEVPGNPWIITTLWVANWKIALARKTEDLQEAREIIEWVASKASTAGLLPEQINPFNNKPLSVAPLTWSHSTFVDTVLRYSEKYQALKHS